MNVRLFCGRRAFAAWERKDLAKPCRIVKIMQMSFRFPWRLFKPGSKQGPSSESTPVANQAESDYRRGVELESNGGTPPDYCEAARWYAQAAEQNHGPAQFSLAMLYAHGHGVQKDQARALLWLTRAARLGNPAAQYRLGVHEHIASREGEGDPPGETRTEALKWLRLSAAQGYRGAEAASEFVALEMTKAQVAECDRRVATFVGMKERSASDKDTLDPSTT